MGQTIGPALLLRVSVRICWSLEDGRFKNSKKMLMEKIESLTEIVSRVFEKITKYFRFFLGGGL